MNNLALWICLAGLILYAVCSVIEKYSAAAKLGLVTYGAGLLAFLLK